MNKIFDFKSKKEIDLNSIEAKKLLKQYVSQYNNFNGGKQTNFKNIEPQTILSMFNNKKIAIVNTLSDDLCINPKHESNSNCYGKNFVNSKKINDFEVILVYCANYTCPASKDYAKKIVKKLKNKNCKIYDYHGGIYEWALLSLVYEDFTIFDKSKDRKLNQNEVVSVLTNFNHWIKPKGNKLLDKLPSVKKYTQQIVKGSNSGQLLKDKVCVVTGATSGLGLETLQCMLDNGAKHVTGTFYNDEKRAKKVNKELSKKYKKEQFIIIRADARTQLGNKKTFSEEYRKKLNIPKDCIAVDCVDINAGIFGPASYKNKHIHRIDIEKYDEVLDLNLRGYVLGVQEFVRQAIKHKISDAAIVCIKSIYGSGGSLFSNPAYQISKHGTMGLVRQTAIELARPSKKLGIPHKIRINAVSPTFTTTALTETMLSFNDVKNTIEKSNPSGKLADKNSIAKTVCWLLSNNARDITGSDFPVDCGVLAEVVPTINEIKNLNEKKNIEFLSCCGNTND